MNLKTKTKNFFTLTRKANGGFTLVELIVVIAILAILGGVAVPAYSGYVTKANKQADITLASEVAQALMLKYYSEPMQNMAASVVLTTSRAETSGEGDFAAKAMEAAFGTNWQTAAKLSYDKWGNGAKVASNVLYHIVTNKADANLGVIFSGDEVPSYANDIDNLYDAVEYLSGGVGDTMGKASGATLLHDAAVEMTDTTKYGDAAAFANVWRTGGDFGDFFTKDGKTPESGDSFVAWAGAIKARNVAIANYIRTEMLKPEYMIDYNAEDVNSIYNALAQLNNASFPDDLARPTEKEENGETKITTPQEKIRKALEGVALSEGADYLVDLAVGLATEDYFNDAVAKTDGLGYYAMMSTVVAAGAEQEDETYWDEMESGIDMYKAALAGADLGSLLDSLGQVTEDSIVVTLYVVDGECKLLISPIGAKAE